MTSRLPGFWRQSPPDRRAALVDHGWATQDVAATLANGGLDQATADHMVENVVGTFALPNAVAVNLLINGEDRVVPMVVEEPSVVAAVSHMGRLTRAAGGLTAASDPSEMIGQVHLPAVPDPAATVAALEASRAHLFAVAAAVHPRLAERGGGLRDLSVRHVVYDETGQPEEHLVLVEFVLDCCDAMGANMVNTVAERLAPHVEEVTGLPVGLRILSNLASRRVARASVRMPVACFDREGLDGAAVAAGIASAWRFAWADPWRAATHNKGVMNGVDAVALATGNDWRAIEAGAHAWCARDGAYRPMTTWRVVDGALEGSIEVPLQLGTVGGTSRLHPTARANLALLGDRGAQDLAAVAAAVGLVQNLGALKALATEGIQAGHMRMHARTVAASAGATPAEIPEVVERLCAEGDFGEPAAARILADLRSEAG